MLVTWRHTAPATLSSLRKVLRPQTELAPGTGGPSSPISQEVPSSPCPPSVSGPPVSLGPAQENAVVSFYSCPAIIFSQLGITLAKLSGSFYCFRPGFPFSPSPGKFLLRLRLHRLRAPSPPPASSPQGDEAPWGTLPCLIHPRDPFTPRVGFHRSHPPGWGVPQEGQWRAWRAPGWAANAPSPHSSKLPFPLLQEPLLEARAEGKEWLEVRGRAGDAATPAPTARCLPLWLPQASPAARAAGHTQPRLMR